MIKDRPWRAESVAIELLEKTLAPHLDEIYLKLRLPTVTLDTGAEPATRIKAIWDLCRDQGGTALADLEEIVRKQQELPLPLPLVYFSVADAERDDPHCQRFFMDIVARLAPDFPNRDLRYFDEGNRANSEAWSPWALRAIREAAVLICLYTSEYLRSPYCGRVWAAFRGRLDRDRERFLKAANAPLILPVLWGPPDENPEILPTVVRELEVDHQQLGSQYAQEGLRKIVQHAQAGRRDYVNIYNDFLDRFVAQLNETMAAHPLDRADAIPELHDMPSDFYEAVAERREAGDQGTKYAKFVFIAASEKEIRPLRKEVASYGGDERQWRPYFPPIEKRIEMVGNTIADENDIDAETLPLNADWLGKVRTANLNGNIILVFVDPWTLQLEKYRRHAQDYDATDAVNSSLLVCWNLDDRETSKLEAKLRKELGKVFFNKLRKPTSKVDDKIKNIDDLRAAIAHALFSMRREILDNTANPNVAEGLDFIRPDSVGASATIDDRPTAAAVRLAYSAAGPVRLPGIKGPAGETRP